MKPDKGSLADQMRELHGGAGLSFRYRVIAVCDAPMKNGKCCCYDETYEEKVESQDFEDFQCRAIDYLLKRGWKLTEPILCPSCADGGYDDED